MITAIIIGYILTILKVDTNTIIPQNIVSAPPSIEPVFGKIFADSKVFEVLTKIDFCFFTFTPFHKNV